MGESLVCVCGSMNTLYLPVLVRGTYTSYSQDKDEWKSSFSV